MEKPKKVINFDVHTFAITGANGFIGKNLVQQLVARTDVQLRLLTRNSNSAQKQEACITQVHGDLLKSDTLENLLVPGCTVINLAYDAISGRAENISAARNLTKACIDLRVKRLVHCSTAVVAGRCSDRMVTEESACSPRSEYAATKLLIEQAIREEAQGRLETVIVRPTAVIGPGGQALLKLVAQLVHGNKAINYFRSCLFNKRKMNLVCVENVSAAILFLANAEGRMDGETFIVSQDEEPKNNYRDVEKYFMRGMAILDHVFPRLPFPPIVLELLLKGRNRDVVETQRVYDSSKIRRAGFQTMVPLESGLSTFIKWYQEQFLSSQRNSP